MMMRNPFLWLFVVLLSFWARAEPPALDLLFEQALELNPRVSAARAAVEKAHYERKAGYSDFIPWLSADAQIARRGSDNSTGAVKTSDQTSYGISASQSLFAGGANQANLDLRSSRLAAAEADLAAVSADVTYQIRRAFADLVFSHMQAELARTIKKRQEENVDLIELRYEGGRENLGAVLRTRALLADADYSLAQAGRNIAAATRELAAAIGIPDVHVSTASSELIAKPPPDSVNINELARSVPGFARSQAAVDAAMAAKKSARSEYWPDLDANAGATRSGDGWPPNQDGWSVGLILRYPFFPGGRNYMDNLSADAELRRVRDQMSSDVADIELLLLRSLHAYQSAFEQLEVLRAFSGSAQMRAEIAREQYASGLISFEDWDRIEGEWTSSQKNELAGHRAAVIAEADWDRVRGINRLDRLQNQEETP